MENLQLEVDVHKDSAGPVKTADDAIQWMREVSKRGEYPASTVSDCCSALASFMEVVDPAEPADVQWILDNVEILARRWATKNANSATAKTYKSRAKRILAEYVRFLENPMGFTPTPTGRPRKKRNGTNGSSGKTQETAKVDGATPAHKVKMPTGSGGVVVCEWEEPFTVKDVDRFAYLLRGYASDFGLATEDEV